MYSEEFIKTCAEMAYNATLMEMAVYKPLCMDDDDEMLEEGVGSTFKSLITKAKEFFKSIFNKIIEFVKKMKEKLMKLFHIKPGKTKRRMVYKDENGVPFILDTTQIVDMLTRIRLRGVDDTVSSILKSNLSMLKDSLTRAVTEFNTFNFDDIDYAKLDTFLLFTPIPTGTYIDNDMDRYTTRSQFMSYAGFYGNKDRFYGLDKRKYTQNFKIEKEIEMSDVSTLSKTLDRTIDRIKREAEETLNNLTDFLSTERDEILKLTEKLEKFMSKINLDDPALSRRKDSVQKNMEELKKTVSKIGEIVTKHTTEFSKESQFVLSVLVKFKEKYEL